MSEVAIVADLRLTKTATGEYYLPNRYSKKESPLSMSHENVTEIKSLIEAKDHVFYVVKKGTLAVSRCGPHLCDRREASVANIQDLRRYIY